VLKPRMTIMAPNDARSGCGSGSAPSGATRSQRPREWRGPREIPDKHKVYSAAGAPEEAGQLRGEGTQLAAGPSWHGGRAIRRHHRSYARHSKRRDLAQVIVTIRSLMVARLAHAKIQFWLTRDPSRRAKPGNGGIPEPGVKRVLAGWGPQPSSSTARPGGRPHASSCDDLARGRPVPIISSLARAMASI
jgi:hypothetical protein